MDINTVNGTIVDAALLVHKKLGLGLLGPDRLRAECIIFRQTPSEVKMT